MQRTPKLARSIASRIAYTCSSALLAITAWVRIVYIPRIRQQICFVCSKGSTIFFNSAAVGRVVKFFGAPLITTGGFTFDFTQKKTECKDEYFMTTRVGNLAFRDLANFFIALMNR